MKKYSAKKCLALCAALALGVTLTGCAPSAVIKGNYRTPTEEELTAALNAVDPEQLFAEDPALSLRQEFSVDMSAPDGTVFFESKGKYDIQMQGETSIGAGDLELRASSTGEEIAVGALTGDFYHDGDCLYMDVLDGNESYRGKIPLTELSALLEEYLEYLQTGTAVPLIAGSGHGGSEISPDLQTMFSVGLDDGDGIKLKLAANDNFFTTIEESVTGGSDAIEFSFRSKILELYLSIDGDGRFEQLSARIDLAYEASYEGQSLEMRAKGEFILRTGNAAVRLPDELSDEEEYPFFTDNGFLPSPM